MLKSLARLLLSYLTRRQPLHLFFSVHPPNNFIYQTSYNPCISPKPIAITILSICDAFIIDLYWDKVRSFLFLFFSLTLMFFTTVIVDLYHTSQFLTSFFILFIFNIIYDFYDHLDYYCLLQYCPSITNLWKENLVLRVKYYHM